MTIFFVLTTVVCAFGWFISRIASIALVRYIKVKGYEPPTAEETKECTRWAAKRVFKRD